MSHVAPPSPVLSMCSAYFPSPRGYTLFNRKILSVLSVPPPAPTWSGWQIHCPKLHRYTKKPICKSFIYLPLLRTPCRVSPFLASLTQTPGVGVLKTFALSFASAVTCATWRLYPLCPHSIAHTSRRHGGWGGRSRFSQLTPWRAGVPHTPL